MYKEGFGNIPNKDKLRAMFDKAYKQNQGRWIIHSYVIGKTAEKIAPELGLDSDIALACGSLHDIGKAYGHEGLAHMLEGFRILRAHSYFFPAKIALGHGFVTDDIDSYHGEVNVSERDYELIRDLLKMREKNPYEDLIIILNNLIKYEYLGLKKREAGRDLKNADKEARLKRMDILRDMEADLISRLKKPIESYLPRPRYYKFPYKLFRKGK